MRGMVSKINKLSKAEFYKLFHSIPYWVLLVFSLGMGGLRGLMAISRGNFVTGYEMYAMELSPDLIYAVLITAFMVTYVCDEFSNCTFSMSLFCGFPRGMVFKSKALVFFLGVILLIALPVTVATGLVTLGNGFGVLLDNSVAMDLAMRFLCYNLRYLFLGSFGLLTASIVRDRTGSFGVSLAGMAVLIFVAGNRWEEPEFIRKFVPVCTFGIAGLSAAATFLFMKQDLK